MKFSLRNNICFHFFKKTQADLDFFKKKIPFYLILLTCIALFGLFSVQWYWIRKVQTTEHNVFKNTVRSIMIDAVQGFERQCLMQNVSIANELEPIINQLDSLNILTYQHLQKYPEFQNILTKPIPVKNLTRKQLTDAITHHSFDKESFYNDSLSKWNNIAKANKNVFAYEDFQSIQNQKKILLKRLLSIIEYADKYLSHRNYYAITSHLPVEIVDSLIRRGFEEERIDLEYEYGFYNGYRNVFLYQSTGDYSEKLKKSEYIYPIFSTDNAKNQVYLVLYFPNENKFVYSHIWNMFFITMLLIVILVFSFLFSFNSIFKQKKLTELKNDFINNMTHELKTPIAAISLSCEVLSDPNIEVTPDMQKYYTGVIQQENRRMQTLTEQILQIARIESGSIGDDMEVIDIHAIVQEVSKNLEILVTRKGGEIKYNLQAQNPQIFADKTHITNMLYNLIDNANKYSIDHPQILVSTYNIDSNLVITVQDHGIGIAHEHIGKIFDKLYRIPTGNVHNVKGFGLGLNYVKTIVDKHGGTIKVESELKQGSIFTISFPQPPEL